MHVHRYERAILGLTALFLAIAGAALAYSVLVEHHRLPGPVERVDPTTVRQVAPFNNPGVTQTGPTTYQVTMLAQTWSFIPQQIEVPRDSTVNFLVTSADVIHGFIIQDTDANLMLIPGQVSSTTVTFHTPGTYLLMCHEYCGAGHQGMFARIVIQ
ncbi:MAG: cytochrome c oxidase subunit II [Chloroflexi bacterium]|nr:cytochrome c oxidase subunit II [Chloroflexota bacterium]MBV9897938.1 cytochrome c oxidase subunit II [Chloroflexota bacterium]